MLLYYYKVRDLLYGYENMKTFHVRVKIKRKHTAHKDMWKKFTDSQGDLETKRNIEKRTF